MVEQLSLWGTFSQAEKLHTMEVKKSMKRIKKKKRNKHKQREVQKYVLCNKRYMFLTATKLAHRMWCIICAKGRSQWPSSHTNSLNSVVCRGRERAPHKIKFKLVDDCLDHCCLEMEPFEGSSRGFVQVAQREISLPVSKIVVQMGVAPIICIYLRLSEPICVAGGVS